MSKADFNIQVTRVIARLYEAHPTPILIDSKSLCVPPLDRAAPDHARCAVAGGTLTWLYRNGIVSGKHTEVNDGSATIAGAQLTASAYRLAETSESLAGGKPLGQVAVDAVADAESPDNTGIDLVSRRFTGT